MNLSLTQENWRTTKSGRTYLFHNTTILVHGNDYILHAGKIQIYHDFKYILKMFHWCYTKSHFLWIIFSKQYKLLSTTLLPLRIHFHISVCIQSFHILLLDKSWQKFKSPLTNQLNFMHIMRKNCKSLNKISLHIHKINLTLFKLLYQIQLKNKTHINQH